MKVASLRILTVFILSSLIALSLAPSLTQVRADTNASGTCGTSQICSVYIAANGCMACNSTPYVSVSNVHWTASNRTLGFTTDGNSGTSATANVTIPKSAVRGQDATNIKTYVKGALLPSSQVKITMNATCFFTAFNVTFASPVNAALSLGILDIPTFPAASVTLLTILLAAIVPSLRRKQ
jgi:hypothetical protein